AWHPKTPREEKEMKMEIILIHEDQYSSSFGLSILLWGEEQFSELCWPKVEREASEHHDRGEQI
ncbi:hypothetical protein A2U01_0036109, partial [Trifolium medium]|nr:hypothetical protein [Trifolium medium]